MAGYHLFSTGEVLSAANVNDYLMKQTTMIFASASARTTALSGVLREGMVSYRTDAHVFEVYNGTAWVASETNLTTKGDLATFDTAPTRLAVGSDGQTLVANSSNASGLGWSPLNAAGKNAIINGAFNVWQRGTSFTPTPGGGIIYTADRFNSYNNGTGALTISQQALTPGSITGYESPYYLQAALASAGTTTGWNWVQPIENVQTFAGQTVTLSFWAKSTNSATTTITFSQKFGSGGSTQVDTNSSAITLTSTWTRYTATVTLPSISGKTIGTGSSLTLTWNMGATVSTYGFWGVQLEAGSVATAFQTATGTLQGELAACQRYYYRQTGDNLYANFGIGTCNALTTALVNIMPPVTMRVKPTSVDFSTLRLYDGSVAWPITSLALNSDSSGAAQPQVTATASTGTFTLTRNAFIQGNNSASAYVGFSAEL